MDRQREKGLTLTEIMVTVVIFTVFALAILSAVNLCFSSAAAAKETNMVVNLGQEKMEEIKNLSYNNISLVADALSDTVTTDALSVTRTVTVQEPANPLHKRVEIVLTWTSRARKNAREELVCLFSP